jgi:hypothetical protein
MVLDSEQAKLLKGDPSNSSIAFHIIPEDDMDNFEKVGKEEFSECNLLIGTENGIYMKKASQEYKPNISNGLYRCAVPGSVMELN